MKELTIVAERLALSRERLRQTMQQGAKPFKGASKPLLGATGAAWVNSFKSAPGVSIILEAVGSWWARHPLRLASMVAAEAATAVVQPIAQRNPVGLVLGALVLGGVVVWSRPWRWILKPVLLAGLFPQLLSKVITHAPSRSWMTVLMSLAEGQRNPARPAKL